MLRMTRGVALALVVVFAFGCGGSEEEDSGGGDKDSGGAPTSQPSSGGGDSGGGTGTSSSRATPQETVAAFKAAAAENDYEGMLATIAPDSRAVYGLSIAMMSMIGFMGNEEAQAEFKTISDKHGISIDAAATAPLNDAKGMEKFAKKTLGDANIAELLADVEALATKDAPEGMEPLTLAAMGKEALKDFEISGNKATAKTVGNGSDVPFVKIDGEWYFATPTR